MTTYNTYQEAKIANPESNIYIHTGEFWCEKSIRPSPWTYELRGFKLCNPADYCMTVERFLSSGHKFVKSDVVFDFGDVVSIDTEFDVETYNKTDKMDDRRYILRAAALEDKTETESEYDKGMREAMKKIVASCGRVFGADVGYEDLPDLVDSLINPPNKKPRTKVEYVKCEFSHAWEAVKAFENGEKLYTKRSHKDYILIDNAPDVLRFLYDLHERIETPMTEREAFVESVEKIGAELTESGDWSFACLAALIFDGKLVN